MFRAGFFLEIQMKTIAIQGIEGCFHDMAARDFFHDEDIHVLPCESFHALFDRLADDSSRIGIVAIENTIAGSLLENYQLIRDSGFSIIGEQKLRIKQNLCALRGEHIETIREVISHPIALMQCGKYLDQNKNFKVVEFDDTANAARTIAHNQMHGVAAICGSLAADLYDLDILAEGIETNKHNFTRFLILASGDNNQKLKPAHPDKASLVFAVEHNPGSLSQVLAIISFYGVNLTKIQSLPIIGREWEYLFYIDVSFTDYDRYRQSVEAIMPLTRDLKILGEYKQCELK